MESDKSDEQWARVTYLWNKGDYVSKSEILTGISWKVEFVKGYVDETCGFNKYIGKLILLYILLNWKNRLPYTDSNTTQISIKKKSTGLENTQT